jgi:RNase P/RNase MRP subunit p29
MACEKSSSASVQKQHSAKLAPLLGEIIGERVFVKDSSCRERVALKGVVIDETLSTLLVRTDGGETKRIPKQGSVFVFPSLGGAGGCEARGEDFACRPEDRTKKLASKIGKTKRN